MVAEGAERRLKNLLDQALVNVYKPDKCINNLILASSVVKSLGSSYHYQSAIEPMQSRTRMLAQIYNFYIVSTGSAKHEWLLILDTIISATLEEIRAALISMIKEEDTNECQDTVTESSETNKAP